MARSRRPDLPPVERLAEMLDIPVDHGLLARALTHRSYAYEHGGLPTNERLEFLGDAVLGLVVTDTLYRRHPDLAEGQLAKLRASVVNMRALADVARGLGDGGLGPWVRLGRGEEATGGHDKPSILADTLEAVIGAVYESGGLSAAREFVGRLVDPLLTRAAERGGGLDWKTALQELAAARVFGPPEYVVSEAGPDHAKRFTAVVLLGGREYGTGSGATKKEAEQRAAEVAVGRLAEPGEDAAEERTGRAVDGRAGDGRAGDGRAGDGRAGEPAGGPG